MSDDKAKRKRTKHLYVVLDNPFSFEGGFENSEKARRWIRDRGNSGKQYQVACLIGQPVEVQVEPVEKRSLVPVGEGNTDE